MVRISSVLAAAVALVASLSAGSSAVSAQTFQACRVPSVGVIYMINVGDAPTACLDASHVQFSWTEGGVADNSVTSAKIVDGSITPADLAASATPAGVDFTTGVTFFDPTTTSTTYATLDISHPASGYIIAQATIQVYCTTEQILRLGITNGGTGFEGAFYTVPVANAWTMMFKHEVLEVTGAGTANVNFNALTYSVDTCTNLHMIDFHAFYLPNRY